MGLMRVAALPGDAHTNVTPPSSFRRLPLVLTRLAGGLYVTSAAASLAGTLGTRLTTGGKPNSYGDTSSFSPPNSGLRVQYSTRHFQLIGGSDPPWVAPEIAVEPTLAELREGRDPALDAAIRFRAP